MGKKRKRDIVEQLNGTMDELKKLYVPSSLPCEICQKPVYNYRTLHDVTCSYDCQSILMLSKQNRFLHETYDNTSFEPMKE